MSIMSHDSKFHSVSQLKNLSRTYTSQVPRYTSFPPINRWDKQILPEAKIQLAFQESYEAAPCIDLYIHVPFCASLCYFCACHKKVSHQQKDGKLFLDSLENEVILRTKGRSRKKINQLHFGGGSPTWLSVEQWRELLQLLRRHFDIHSQTSFSVELDSRTLTDAHIRFFAEAGVTRVSFGVQDLDLNVQKAIHREQDWSRLEKQVELLRSLSIEAINFDLVYGLPLQTQHTIQQTIDVVTRLRPSRIALYAYAHVPQMAPAQRLLEKFNRAGEDEKVELFFTAYESLLGMGYVAVGLDHFCLPNDSLYEAYNNGEMQRSFMGYTEQGSAFTLGLGPSAISDFGSGYFQMNKDIKSWLTGDYKLQTWHLLTCDELRLRDDIWRLMCRWELPQNTNSEWVKATQEFVDNKLLSLSHGKHRVTELGRPFVRNIAHRFELCYSST